MLSLSIPILGISILLILFIYKYIIYPSLVSPLAKIPNAHWSAPFSQFWILYIRWSAYENRTVHAAHELLGAVVRLGPGEISINEVNGVRTVYAGGFEKGEWYSIFDNYGYILSSML